MVSDIRQRLRDLWDRMDWDMDRGARAASGAQGSRAFGQGSKFRYAAQGLATTVKTAEPYLASFVALLRTLCSIWAPSETLRIHVEDFVEKPQKCQSEDAQTSRVSYLCLCTANMVFPCPSRPPPPKARRRCGLTSLLRHKASLTSYFVSPDWQAICARRRGDPRIHHPPPQTRSRPILQEARSLGCQGSWTIARNLPIRALLTRFPPMQSVVEFARKAMGTIDVRLDPKLNQQIWNQGIKNVPHRLRLKLERASL